jgi:hypothetical protein
MADLNEQITVVTRKTWDRANKVRIDNEYGQLPKITFEVQTATTDNGTLTGATPKGIVTVNYQPDVVFPLLDPRDDSIIDPAGGSHALVQVILYSLFRHSVGL